MADEDKRRFSYYGDWLDIGISRWLFHWRLGRLSVMVRFPWGWEYNEFRFVSEPDDEFLWWSSLGVDVSWKR